MLLGREDILACVLSFLPPLPGSQVISRKWNETKMTNKISVSPDGGSGVVFLDPPGLGSIDGLPIDPQPGTNLPQPLLKHRDNHAIWICPNVQQVVTTHCHHTHKVLRTECVRITQNHRTVHLKMTDRRPTVTSHLYDGRQVHDIGQLHVSSVAPRHEGIEVLAFLPFVVWNFTWREPVSTVEVATVFAVAAFTPPVIDNHLFLKNTSHYLHYKELPAPCTNLFLHRHQKLLHMSQSEYKLCQNQNVLSLLYFQQKPSKLFSV